LRKVETAPNSVFRSVVTTKDQLIIGAPEKVPKEAEGEDKSESFARLVLKALVKDKISLAGLVIILAVLLSSIFANYIAPYNPLTQSLPNSLKGPSLQHFFGTDELGRDVFSRIIFGSRVSLEVGAGVVSTALLIGLVLGTIAGYYGGKADMIIMRFVDIFLSFPGIILAVGAVAVVGPGVQNVIIALIIINWPGYTRVMRAEVLKAKQNQYVIASRGMGASNFWIMRKHIIPYSLSPIIILATIGFGWAVLAEAGLSFLGLGIAPPTPSWGGMVSEGVSYIIEAPYIAVFAGLAIAVTVLSFNMLGDGLRDALDPSLRI
jgi:peptide/nickel transport system permease protein